MRLSIALALMALLAGCSKRPEPAARTHASAAPIAPSWPALSVVDEQERSGLRIRSGTLAPPSAARAMGSPWGFTDVELNETKVTVRVVLSPGGAALPKLLPPEGLAVVNGGYFEANYAPSTWVVSDGVELAKKGDTARGGVLAVDSVRTYVGPVAGLSFAPSVAVHSFPLIVEPGGKPGIHRDDGRRAARTVACLVGPRLHFVLLAAPRGEGPTLFETSEVLRAAPPRGFGCSAALNLDGGPSSGIWFSPRLGARQRPPLAPVGYALAVTPR